MLLTEDVESLRNALEATVSGTLLATDEARAEAEARHLTRLEVINKLFRGDEVITGADPRHSEAVESLAEEPFTHLACDQLVLVSPSDLDAASVSRLFVSMFDGTVRIPLLSFMIDGYHAPYVARLVELLPDLQSGFSLDEEEATSLKTIATLFPSVWLTVASPIPMITTHRAAQSDVDEVVLAADRASFWETVSLIRNSGHRVRDLQ
jgi:hypothetical protein